MHTHLGIAKKKKKSKGLAYVKSLKKALQCDTAKIPVSNVSAATGISTGIQSCTVERSRARQRSAGCGVVYSDYVL